MNKAIIGKKLGMTQVFLKDGTMVPVTVVKAGPCTVVQKKTVERDGYNSVQLGFEEVAEKKLNKPELGHLKAAGVQPLKILKEFDLSNADSLEVGHRLRRVRGGRLCGRYGHNQGQRLFRRHQALEFPPLEGNARRGSRAQRGRLSGRQLHSQQSFPRQKAARSVRRGAGDCLKSQSGKSRQGKGRAPD